MRERVARYNASAWGQRYAASRLHVVQEKGHDVAYGKWRIGAMFGNVSKFPGAYPRTYLERVMTMFPFAPATLRDARQDRVCILHAFSGGLPASETYHRLDSNPASGAEFIGHVQHARKVLLSRRYQLILADPPYAKAWSESLYGTPMINRGVITNSLADVTEPGGFLVWLDTTWPMFSRRKWITVGSITVIRSTNHALRECSIFERVA